MHSVGRTQLSMSKKKTGRESLPLAAIGNARKVWRRENEGAVRDRRAGEQKQLRRESDEDARYIEDVKRTP